MPTKQTLDDLRSEIERKYCEAISALEIISAYVTEGKEPTSPKPPGDKKPKAERQPPASGEGSTTKVDRVLAAIGAEFKSVEQIATEVQLRQPDVRAVLYSKHARKRVVKGKRGNITTFRLKEGGSHSAKNGDAPNMAALVRDILAKNPTGVTATDIVAKISSQVGKDATNAPAISSALHHMKMRGAVEHNADGTYRLLTI